MDIGELNKVDDHDGMDYCAIIIIITVGVKFLNALLSMFFGSYKLFSYVYFTCKLVNNE